MGQLSWFLLFFVVVVGVAVDLDSYLTWNVGARKQKHEEIIPDSARERAQKFSRWFYERI